MKLFAITTILIFIYISNVELLNILDLGSKNTLWKVENKNGTIKTSASVPGGIYSDLKAAGIIGDIFYRFEDVNTRWVAYDTWTYTGRFSVTEEQLRSNAAHLVFNGLDTVAFININDVPIGNTNNMFVRYVFDVKEHLKVGENELKISFESPVEAAKIRSQKYFTQPDCVPSMYNGECHANQLRKMQASFSWDWGPAFPSVGIWKPVQIEFYDGAIIRSVTTKTELKDNNHWELTIKAHLESSWSKKDITGYLSATTTVNGHQKINVGRNIKVTTKDDGTAEAEITMAFSQNVISLWWPNGYGSQSLYDVDVYLSTRGNRDEVSHKHLRVGFRTIKVIQMDISNILGNETNRKGLSFYFEVNGFPLFMKGSNWIPAHILPEHGSDIKTVDNLLSAASYAHMSMLRVWGGGVYESDHFYRKCDELGILIWQDFLFACAMYPADSEFLDTVKTEIEQNVIRLQHHTSIALWAGNNENEVALRGNWYNTNANFDKYKEEYIKLYVDTIRPIVQDLDDEYYVVSSPSNGLESEREGYIAENPYDPHYGDTHYYNYMADVWDMNTYPLTRFASEYGFQSMPSIETLKTASNVSDDFILDSKFLTHRQHSPNGDISIMHQIETYLKFDENDSIEKFIYYSQIIQAMAMKAETEFYRQSQSDWYTMGALYWQLNDVWQAPSWSGIEYGGKWKMLHYFAKSFFAPVLVSPRLLSSYDVDVYLINDRFVPLEADIIVDVFNWSSLIPIDTKTYKAYVGPLRADKQDFKISLWEMYPDMNKSFLRFTLKAPGLKPSPYNYIFPKPLRHTIGLKEPKLQISVSTPTYPGSSKWLYPVDIRVDTVVLFLWLETTYDGYFDDNGLIITNPYVRVIFTSKRELKPKDLEKAITYQYYII